MSMPKAKTKKSKTPVKKKTKSESPPPDDNLPHLTFYPEEDDTPEVEPGDIRINFDMIVRRNLPEKIQEMSHEDLVSALHAVGHVRLDREQITHIDNLEMLGTKVTNLYLQQNRIARIENLDCVFNLEFLTLSNNRIERIERLSELDDLKFLDLSHNRIQELDLGELPKSLLFLSLRGNPCAQDEGYRESVLAALPNLLQLDGIDRDEVEDDEDSESENDDDSTNNVDEEELFSGIEYPHRSLDEYVTCASVERTDVFDDVMTDLRERSKSRMAEVEIQHAQRQEMLRKLREESQTQ